MIRSQTSGPVTRFDLARSLLGRGRYWTTCYYLDGWLVDTGCAHTAHELLGALQGKPLRGVLNTHTHEDHIGANGLLQQRHPGLEIYAHPLALPVLADPRRQQPLHPYRRLFWGWPTPSQGLPLADGQVIETGRYRLTTIYTPGHKADHVCFFEQQQGWLFSGDLFVGGRDRALGEGYDIWGILDSLRRVYALPIQTLFPASARLRQDPCPDLAARIAYLQELGEKVLALHQQGRSVEQITRALLGGPMWVELVTLGHFSRRNLVLSYLSRAAE